MKFTEEQLEKAFIELMEQQGYRHYLGENIARHHEDVIIEEDIRHFLARHYASQNITEKEISTIILQLRTLSSMDLYTSNMTFMRMIADGFILQREDRTQKDIHIELLDYAGLEHHRYIADTVPIRIAAEPRSGYSAPQNDKNIYKFVTQLEIEGDNKRIPDGIVYINGLPLLVFEFKSVIRENTDIFEAYTQLTTRYRRDIPSLFIYNCFCIISDGINTKAGSFFAPYEYYYAWRRIAVSEKTQPLTETDIVDLSKFSREDAQGIQSMFTLVQGMLHKDRLRDIIRNFIFMPDTGNKEQKIVCRYPQYYAARALYASITKARKPRGNGKGGTYFGATGCGKSYTMLFLTRLLMRSEHFASPTIVLITDRTDLDAQLSEQFVEAKQYIGDHTIVSVESRAHLRSLLQGRQSGGVFLTTIHKFTEDTQVLTERNNVICISDEAHRSQIHLDQKVTITKEGVRKRYGFAKHLHTSLPNAVYVGFTGTPIDATLDVFGKVVDAYTMTESVYDEITVHIVYEGRAAKVGLKNEELAKIERYYEEAAEMGANDIHIEQSKAQTANMYAILGDPKRLQAIAEDFIAHYEARVEEGATAAGKAIFVSSSREIAYELYKKILILRPEWCEKLFASTHSPDDTKEQPIERIKLVMTRLKDDPAELYQLLGTNEYRKELDRHFKNEYSNFKIAIVVDMWLTGFDVPFLDTIYIDKPIQRHNLIQTISRVNRKFSGKHKGLVVDYIGIKQQMNLALKQYNETDKDNFEQIEQSIIVLRDYLDLLANEMHTFDAKKYFVGRPLEQLHTLNRAAEFVLSGEEKKNRFIGLVLRLKAAYDICVGSDAITVKERDYVHFYLAIRSIIVKLTGGTAPDTEQMNKRVREMIKNALESQGVEQLFRFGDKNDGNINLFDKEYLEQLKKIKLPNTKIQLLQQLLSQVIQEIKKINKIQGIDFTKRMETVVERYNTRETNDIFRSELYEEIAEELTNLLWEAHEEFFSGNDLGIEVEEKAFYDILFALCIKYGFVYPEEKMIELARAVKLLVDTQSRFPDWNKREDIKASLKVDLILLLDEYGYPPVEIDEVYNEIFEQAENFKKNRPS